MLALRARFCVVLLAALAWLAPFVSLVAQTPSTRVLIGVQRTYPNYAYLTPGVLPWVVAQINAENRAAGAATGVVTLDSILIPAKTVQNIGNVLEIVADGRDSSHANGVSSQWLVFGSAIRDSTIATINVASGWSFTCRLYVRVAGLGKQGIMCTGLNAGTTTTQNIIAFRDTITVDPTVALAVKVQAFDSITGYVVQTGMHVRAYPIAP